MKCFNFPASVSPVHYHRHRITYISVSRSAGKAGMIKHHFAQPPFLPFRLFANRSLVTNNLLTEIDPCPCCRIPFLSYDCEYIMQWLALYCQNHCHSRGEFLKKLIASTVISE